VYSVILSGETIMIVRAGRVMVCLLLCVTLGVSAVSAQVPALVLPAGIGPVGEVSHPLLLHGLKLNVNAPLSLEALVDMGEASDGRSSAVRDEAARQMRYFLAALAVPEDDLWVNLSPFEADRVVPPALGRTELGQGLLAQDYVLKYVTSLLLHPDDAVGRRFWAGVYKTAAEKFGGVDIPVASLNKVWIMPASADVVERPVDASGTLCVVVSGARLKVMLESDYTAMRQQAPQTVSGDDPGEVSKRIMREVVLPALDEEVNQGKNFGRLRQMYHAMILAHWFRTSMRGGTLDQAYVGRGGVDGITSSDRAAVGRTFSRYTDLFKKGAFDLIREENVPGTSDVLPRHYIAGGTDFKAAAIEGSFHRVSNVPVLRHPAGFTFRLEDGPEGGVDHAQDSPDEVVMPARLEFSSGEEVLRTAFAESLEKEFVPQWNDIMAVQDGAFVGHQYAPVSPQFDPRGLLAGLGYDLKAGEKTLEDLLGNEALRQFDAAKDRLTRLINDVSAGRRPTVIKEDMQVFNGAVLDNVFESLPDRMEIQTRPFEFEPGAVPVDEVAARLKQGRQIDRILREVLGEKAPEGGSFNAIQLAEAFNKVLTGRLSDDVLAEELPVELKRRGESMSSEMNVFLRRYSGDDAYGAPLDTANQRWVNRFVLEAMYGLDQKKNTRHLREKFFRLYYRDFDVMRTILERAVTAALDTARPRVYSEPSEDMGHGLRLRSITGGFYFDREHRIRQADAQDPVMEIGFDGKDETLEAWFREAPEQLVRVYRDAVDHRALIARDVRRVMARVIRSWHQTAQSNPLEGEKARQFLTELLGSSGDVADVLVEMLELGREMTPEKVYPGLLGLLIPEIGNADGWYVEPSHAFSLTYHTLYLLKFLETVGDRTGSEFNTPRELYERRKSDPRRMLLLRAAILFHDMGKDVSYDALTRPHPLTGAIAVAPETLPLRFDMDGQNVEGAVWLIFNHHVLFQRNLVRETGSPDLRRSRVPAAEKLQLAAILGAQTTPDLWEALALISIADAYAYAPFGMDRKLLKLTGILGEYLDGFGSWAAADGAGRKSIEASWRAEEEGDGSGMIEEKYRQWVESTRLTPEFLRGEGLTEQQRDAQFHVWVGQGGFTSWEVYRTSVSLIDGYVGTLLGLGPKLQVKVISRPEISDHGKMLNVTVGVNGDRPGLLRLVSGVLAMMGFNIHLAQIRVIHAADGKKVLDTFTVYRIPGAGSAAQWRDYARSVWAGRPGLEEEFLQGQPDENVVALMIDAVLNRVVTLQELAASPLAVTEFRAWPMPSLPPVRVIWKNGAADYSRLALEAPDRNGLMLIVASILSERFGVNVEAVPVITGEAGAHDVFLLSGKEGRALSEQEKTEIGNVLAGVLSREVITIQQVLDLSSDKPVDVVFPDTPAAVQGGIDMSREAMTGALGVRDIGLPHILPGAAGTRAGLRPVLAASYPLGSAGEFLGHFRIAPR
jgi:hypothetical protein